MPEDDALCRAAAPSCVDAGQCLRVPRPYHCHRGHRPHRIDKAGRRERHAGVNVLEAKRLRHAPRWTGIVLIALGNWSIWFGLFVTPRP